MVQEGKLAAVLSEFARTLVTEFPIQGILDHLVERIVDLMPVTGVGVTLISPGFAPQYVAASSSAALRFEQLQTDIGQGPCLLAYQSGAAVTVPCEKVWACVAVTPNSANVSGTPMVRRNSSTQSSTPSKEVLQAQQCRQALHFSLDGGRFQAST